MRVHPPRSSAGPVKRAAHRLRKGEGMLMFWIDNPAVLLRGWNMGAPPSGPAENRSDEDRGGDGEVGKDQGHDHDRRTRARRDE